MLSARLREFRTLNGLSQTEMAQKLNITRQAYNHYETGRRVPPLNVLRDIARILDTDINTLGGDGAPTLAEKETPAVVNDERWEKIKQDKKKLMIAESLADMDDESLFRLETILKAALLLPPE